MQSTLDDSSGLSAGEVKRRHIVGKAVLVGVIAGVLASAFRVALERGEHLRALAVARAGSWGLPVSIALSMAAGALGVWLVRRFAPHAAGSGIPQLKSILLRESAPEWRRLLPVKFFGGLLTTGGGFALGREGPTVQMGSGVGHMVSEVFKVREGEGSAAR
ncbi:chloride channel protein [Oleiharenicola sp. Vm1]|uniref:chloride channel protein n=1 Tax=Oleiharenicola sp. Vm1 TaxID=3398393 RepID=UPI0039F49509